MYFKVFLEGADNSGRVPLLKVREDASVFDLKILLEKHTSVPVGRQCIRFSEKTLDDEVLMAEVTKKCQRMMMQSNKIGDGDADIMVYNNDRIMCRMQYIEDLGCGSPRMSMSTDIDMNMDLALDSMTEFNSVASLPSGLESQICGLAKNSCSQAESTESSPSESSESDSGGCSASASASKNDTQAALERLREKHGCPPMEEEEDEKCIDPCIIACCENDGRPPYARVLPEDRRYGVMITNDENPDETDFSCILIYLVEQFQESEDAQVLSFSQCTSAVAFDNALLIVCEDNDTQDWLLRAARPMCPPYRVTTFIKHFELVRCSFVIPMVIRRSMCRIFLLFEKQNCGLDTSKWCVMTRTLLDTCVKANKSRVIYADAPNDEVIVYIDEESVEYITKHCSKVRYLLWHLPFDCCQAHACQ
ncbi:hypothetical protein KR009_004972 [Drosophila setifemur]|nr:hypothetical protein KR009_004972 [Drosophila setifemur]